LLIFCLQVNIEHQMLDRGNVIIGEERSSGGSSAGSATKEQRLFDKAADLA